MKIRPKTETLNEAELLRQKQLARKTGGEFTTGAPSSQAQSEDTVKVGLAKAIAQLSAPRSERIAELKALIESGQYKVDSRRIADAIATTLDEEITLEKLLSI